MAKVTGYTKETKQKADGSDSIRYRLDNKFVKESEVPEEVKAALNGVDEGVAVDENGQVVEQGSEAPESTDDKDGVEEQNEAPEQDPEIDSADDVDDDSGIDEEVPTQAGPIQEEGMGFKRVKGKTVDIFDGKTPHQQVRYVDGIMVPLSNENYAGKTDGEIRERLRKLGKL